MDEAPYGRESFLCDYIVLYLPCPLHLLGVLGIRKQPLFCIPDSESSRSVLGDLASGGSHTTCLLRHHGPLSVWHIAKHHLGCLLNTSSLLEQDVGCTLEKKSQILAKPNNEKNELLGHSAILTLVIYRSGGFPTPESRETHDNDALGKQVGVFGSFSFPRSSLFYLRCTFPSGKNTRCAPPSHNVHHRLVAS